MRNLFMRSPFMRPTDVFLKPFRHVLLATLAATFTATWFFPSVPILFAEESTKPAGEDTAPAGTEKADTAKTDIPPATGNATPATDPGLAALEEATERKLQLAGEDDLDTVIELCEKALDEGLTGDNLDFAQQLLTATRLQRGLLLSETLLKVPANQLPEGWKELRSRAAGDLEFAAEADLQTAQCRLMLARLETIPPVDEEKLTSLVEKAIEAGKGDPEILAAAYLMRVLLEKDPEKKEAIFEKAVRETEGNSQLMLLQVATLAERKKYDEAMEVLQKLIETEPEKLGLLRIALDIRWQQGKYDDALKIIDALLEEIPGEPDLLFKKSFVFIFKKKADAAIQNLNRLRRTLPRDPRIPWLRGIAYSMKKDYSKALADADAAIRLAPDFIPPKKLKAEILTAEKRFDEAVTLLKEAVETLPEGEDGENSDRNQLETQLGTVHIAAKDYDAAAEVVAGLLEKAPDGLDGIALKTDLLVARKKHAQAVSVFKEALEKWEAGDSVDRERLPRLRMQLVSLMLTAKQYDEALALAEKEASANPEDMTAVGLKANVLLHMGRHAEAGAVYDAVLEKEPDDELALNNLSWLLSTSPEDTVRDGKKALELALKACELTEYKKAYILSTLAAAYAELGQFDKAVEWSRKSVDLAEKEDEDRLDDLKRELEAFQRNEPWREVLSEADKDEDEGDNDGQKTETGKPETSDKAADEPDSSDENEK